MAIAGRVAIVPKGEWSQSVTYDKLDLVTYNGNTFIAYKSSVGVEPVDGDTWMLVMQGIDPQDIENIIDGTTPVGDTLKLGGKDANEYVQKDGSVVQSAVGKNGYIAYPEDGQLYVATGNVIGKLRIKLPTAWVGARLVFTVTISEYSNLATSKYYIEAYLNTGTNVTKLRAVSIGSNTEMANLPVTLAHDGTNCVVTIGANDTKIWNSLFVSISDITVVHYNTTYDMWRKGWNISVTSDNSDLTVHDTVENPFIGANYLPITGALAKSPSNSNTAMTLQSTKAESRAYLGFVGSLGAALGLLGFSDVNTPVFVNKDATATYPLLHTGNVGSYALPKSGGTITNAILTPLSVNNSHADATGTYIGFLLRGVAQGYIGVANGALKFTKDGIAYDILHTGNKPSGTYTGNGSAKSRTISTGNSVGNSCIILSDKGMVLLTSVGGIGKKPHDTTVTGLGASLASCLPTRITIVTDNELLNASGVTYNYYYL